MSDITYACCKHCEHFDDEPADSHDEPCELGCNGGASAAGWADQGGLPELGQQPREPEENQPLDEPIQGDL